MEPWAIVVYILLFSTSSAGLAGLGFLAFRRPNPTLRWFFWMDLSLGFGLLTYLFTMYLGTAFAIIGASATGLFEGLRAGTALAMVLTYGFLLRLLWAFVPRQGWIRWFRRVTLVVWILVLALVVGSLLARSVPFLSPFAPVVPPITGFILITLGVSMAGLVVYFGGDEAPMTLEASLIRGWGITLMSFLPLSILEALVETYHWLGFQSLQFDYLLYFICNALVLVTLVRSMRSSPGAALSGTPAPGPEDLGRWGLTAREQEIIPLIARGLANKEIASELGISAATVRTHIYNLYQKAGVQSRIGLLNKLGQISGTD